MPSVSVYLSRRVSLRVRDEYVQQWVPEHDQSGRAQRASFGQRPPEPEKQATRQEQGFHVSVVAGGWRVRSAPFLPGQRPAGCALVVHLRRILRVRLAPGRVLHRRVRGRRQQRREIHAKSQQHDSGALQGKQNTSAFTFTGVYSL